MATGSISDTAQLVPNEFNEVADSTTPPVQNEQEEPHGHRFVLQLPNISFSSQHLNVFRAGIPVIVFSNDIRRYIAVVILFAVNLVNYMDRFTVAGVLTDVVSYFDIGDDEAGLIQTVFVCSFMLFAPIFGYCGDRYSRKAIMIFGLVVWSIAVLSSSFVAKDQFWLFIILRAVVGIGEASYTTVAPTIIADLFTKDVRSRMLMIFYFAIPVGSGLGFVVGAAVADAFGTWKWAVRITPIFGAVCLLLLIFVLKEPQRGESQHASSSSALAAPDWKKDFVQIITNKTYIWSTLGFTAVAFVAGSLSWWAPTYLVYAEQSKHGAISESMKAGISQIFGIITVMAGIIGVTLGSGISQMWRRFNPRADPLVCAIGMFICTPCLFGALVVVEYNINLTWVLIFIAETSSFLNWAVNADILMYIMIPSRRATASAFQILFSHLLGDASSPYIIGRVESALESSDTSFRDTFVSLQRAMFITTFASLLSGLFFLVGALYVEGDKARAEAAVEGLLSESVLDDDPNSEWDADITEQSEVSQSTIPVTTPTPETRHTGGLDLV